MRIALGSDHAGFELKERIKGFLRSLDIAVEDLGAESTASVDYPDYAAGVAEKIRSGDADRGILVCGTGIGMCIAANKINGVRAVVAWDPEIAVLTRQHNDANVLCLPGRFLESPAAEDLVRIWLETPFENGRHQRRIDKITALERRGRDEAV